MTKANEKVIVKRRARKIVSKNFFLSLPPLLYELMTKLPLRRMKKFLTGKFFRIFIVVHV